MEEWLAYRAFLIPAGLGCLVGWAMVQMFKAMRRNRHKPKWANLVHRSIAMVFGGLGALVGTMLDGLNNHQIIAVAVLTGLLCPTAWGLAIRATRGQQGWLGKAHWFFRGNRRMYNVAHQPHHRRSDDPDDTWY